MPLITWNDDDKEHVWIPHTVGQEVDYTPQWAGQLAEDGGDTIDAATIVVTQHASLTFVRRTQTTTTVTVWFRGGIKGQDVWFKVAFTTIGGRKYEKTLWLRCT